MIRRVTPRASAPHASTTGAGPRPGRRAILATTAGTAAALALPGSLRAATYPTRPVTLIVPLGPGGVGDVGGRIVAKRLGEVLGTSVVIENRPGGNQVVGAGAVARAAPDGYTLLWTTAGFVASPVLVKDFPLKPLTDFVPIAFGASSNNVIVGARQFPTLADFVEQSKRAPGTMFYGTPSGATTLVFEYLKLVSGAKIEPIMYKGTPNAWTDLIGGRIHALLDGPALSKGHVEAGRATALAVCGAKRAPELPNTPTAAESGYPDFVIETWQGLFAPAGTPADIRARLEAAMKETMSSAEVTKQLADTGLDGRVLIGDAFAAEVRRYAALWASVAQRAGVQPQ